MTSFCSKKKTMVQISYKNSHDAAKTAFMNTLHRENFHIFLDTTHDGAKQNWRESKYISVCAKHGNWDIG